MLIRLSVVRPLILGVATVLVLGIGLANCLLPNDGQIVKIEVKSCQEIVADRNAEVQKNAGPLYQPWNLKQLYTGALITDVSGGRWMYPSEQKTPCKPFQKKSLIEKRAYYTCCDSGAWGKCVFGGKWLGDIKGRPINAFQ